MNRFTVDDIRDVFASDLAGFIADVRVRLERFSSAEASLEDLNEPERNAHSMKGVAAMVGAWGLSWLGEDFECLYEVARSFFHAERERASEIARFILSVTPRWEEMAALTLGGEMDRALAVYRSIRADVEPLWGGYLPLHEVPELETPEVEPEQSYTPAPEAAGLARRVMAPELRVADQVEDEADSEPLAIRPTSEVAGLARQASQPTFRIVTDEEDWEDLAPVQIRPAASLAGAARAVVAPVFRLKEEAASLDLRTLFREEASGYLGELAVSLGKLRAEDATSLWEEARRLSHTLKGSAAQVGLLEVSEQAKTAEFIARAAEEDPADRSATRVADLIRAIEQVARLMEIPFQLVTPERVAEPEVPAEAVTIDESLVAAFLMDAREQLEHLESALLDWERGIEVTAARAQANRAYHTLKGAANSLGFTAVGASIHAAEELLEHLGIQDQSPESAAFKFLFTSVDQLRSYADALARNPSHGWSYDWAATVALLRAPSTAMAAGAPAPASDAQAAEPEFDPQLVRAVADDIRDQASVLEAAVLGWEREQGAVARVQDAYRACHTLKGSANSVELHSLGADFHALESLLDRAVKAGAPKPAPDLVAFLLRVVDQMRRYAEDLHRDPRSPWPNDWKAEVTAYLAAFATDQAGASAEETAVDDSVVVVETIRVDLSRIHKLMNQVGELVVERNRFAAKLDRAIQLRNLLGNNRQQLSRVVERFQDQFEYSSARQRSGGLGGRLGSSQPLQSSADEFSELEFDRYDEFNLLARQLNEVADDLGQVTVELEKLIESFRTDEQRFGANSKVMQEDITSLTSQPVNGLFRRLDRIFRDATHTEGKDATLRFEGGGTTLDRAIVERLHTPLLHLVRNAVAHGIESPDDRALKGKPRAGAVTVGASQSANQIILTIRDDGSGIDSERVLRRAIDRGLVPNDTSSLTHEQTLNLIFTPGFSTAEVVSAVAGRGIGMDVVKSEIEAMNGSVTAEWEAGKGTTWRLQLPLSLAVTEAIIVGVGGHEYGIPLNFTESGLLLSSDQVRVRDGVECYVVGDAELPLVRLANVFGIGDSAQCNRGVIVSVGDRRCVLAVERVPARREIVVKGFDPLLARHPLFEGATLDAEGRPVLILNAPALLRFAHSGAIAALSAKAFSQAQQQRSARERQAGELLTALVVDDSLSVRTVQERWLGELGCEVILATDGLDAIEKLRAHRIDIIFTDLEMPRMNGYDLISTVRLNPNWSSIPMVLVTSRAGQKHLDKALLLGCNDFLIKPFGLDDLARLLDEQCGYRLASVA